MRLGETCWSRGSYRRLGELDIWREGVEKAVVERKGQWPSKLRSGRRSEGGGIREGQRRWAESRSG